MANNDLGKNFVQTLMSIVRNELKVTPQLIPGSIIRRNANGSYVVKVPGSEETITVNNQTPFILEAGDVVSLFLKNRDKLSDSFIVEAKGKSNNGNTSESTEGSGGTTTINVRTYTGSVALIMVSSGWVNGIYSFENIYPSSIYNISIELDGALATSTQLNSWSNAKICGDSTINAAHALGTVPIIDLPIILTYTNKDIEE